LPHHRTPIPLPPLATHTTVKGDQSTPAPHHLHASPSTPHFQIYCFIFYLSGFEGASRRLGGGGRSSQVFSFFFFLLAFFFCFFV